MNIVTTDITIWIDKFLEHLIIIRNLSENTINAYSSDLQHWSIYIDSKKLNWLEVNRQEITSFLVYLNTNKKISKRSRARCISVLRSFYKFSIKQKVTEKNPFLLIQAPKFSKKIPKPIPMNEMQILLNSELCTEDSKNKKLEIRDIALWELAYSGGLRISEILGLNISNILELDDDLKSQIIAKQIKIKGKGNKERMVFINTSSQKALKRYIDIRIQFTNIPSETALFLNIRGTRLTRRGALFILKNRLNNLNLSTKYKPHSFRHSFATDLLNNGAEIRHIQEMLGHSSISTTQNYAHVAIDKLKETFMKCHPHARSEK